VQNILKELKKPIAITSLMLMITLLLTALIVNDGATYRTISTILIGVYIIAFGYLIPEFKDNKKFLIFLHGQWDYFLYFSEFLICYSGFKLTDSYNEKNKEALMKLPKCNVCNHQFGWKKTYFLKVGQ
jgi:hypothetical protein